MTSIFTDPFLYFGIAVWPFSYFLYKYKIVQWFQNFNGFHLKQNIPINILPHLLLRKPLVWETNHYFDMKVHRWNLNWNLYQVCSMLFFAAFLDVMFTWTQFNENIVMLRSGNIFNIVGTGHWMIWVAALIVYTRFGLPFNFVKGIYAMAFFGGLHEGMWYIAYIISVAGVKALYINSPFLILISGMIFGYLLLFRKDHKNSKLPSENAWLSWKRITVIVLALAMFYFLWLEVGFPVTLSIFTGRTEFFFSPVVNLIEILSWIMPAFLFL